jgi:pre-mRNA-splicing helicase BRR2
VLQQAGKNQVLIFTHSRAETAKTALALKELAEANDTLTRFVREDSASLEILRLEGASAKNTDLQELLPYGFAIHHAGMVYACDRICITIIDTIIHHILTYYTNDAYI